MKKLLYALISLLAFLKPKHSLAKAEGHSEEGSWQSGQTEYEGFPLLLRRQIGLDYSSLPPKLVALEHLLEKTKSNGLPEADYNESLFEFDHDVISTFGEYGAVVVLIETFGHKRNYYAYCPNEVTAEQIEGLIKTRYAEFRLQSSEKLDPDARFIKKYAKEHL